MVDVENILNDDDFPGDSADTPKEGIEQYKKREYLRCAIIKGITYLLGGKWTLEKLNKASDETINKMYTEYTSRELNEKNEKTGKALGKQVINLYFNGISWLLKIKDAKKLRQGIENDPIIKDQMAGLGCLFVCTFRNYLAPILIAAHTANNLDLGHELENEGYESD